MFGAPVTHNPDLVRDLVAVCKQDDYLYPDLTARQHLLVFGGIRGVPEVEIEQTTQEWLESVDLALVQDQHSSGFSGGMKRRLSLALSTIGHRPLVILDEPTTGKLGVIDRRALILSLFRQEWIQFRADLFGSISIVSKIAVL